MQRSQDYGYIRLIPALTASSSILEDGVEHRAQVCHSRAGCYINATYSYVLCRHNKWRHCSILIHREDKLCTHSSAVVIGLPPALRS